MIDLLIYGVTVALAIMVLVKTRTKENHFWNTLVKDIKKSHCGTRFDEPSRSETLAFVILTLLLLWFPFANMIIPFIYLLLWFINLSIWNLFKTPIDKVVNLIMGTGCEDEKS